MTRDEWVQAQVRNPWHWGSMLALWGLGFYTLGWAGHGHQTAAIVGWGLFLLVETAPMLWTMLAFAGAMMLLSRIFPPAAIIFLIIGIVFFLLRIRYVIQNAQLLISGFLVYMVYYELFFRPDASGLGTGGSLLQAGDPEPLVCHALAAPAPVVLPGPAPGRRIAGAPGPSAPAAFLPKRI